jgi:GNAT superfamily N-acetyltransferase
MPQSGTICISLEDPFSAMCAQLIAELSAELGALYGGDGAGAFTPADVAVPRAAFIVAWLDDEPVGCGALRPMEADGIAEIKRMYVRPSARGKGLSRHILWKLEALARNYGYTRVWLETGTRQREALGLYETSGYRRMDCYGQYANEPLSVCFEKNLLE